MGWWCLVGSWRIFMLVRCRGLGLMICKYMGLGMIMDETGMIIRKFGMIIAESGMIISQSGMIMAETGMISSKFQKTAS
ncbi:hypothetical protein [Bacillus sp. MMSF_3328]|uniref:hypothetical protein n=1 Tax=Bacillus sp. MMSF_3328 TaxID=3047080 RepID=UPI00273ECFCD|nr:hypothetical protein [Bacillus sp. MMSF_3328]